MWTGRSESGEDRGVLAFLSEQGDGGSSGVDALTRIRRLGRRGAVRLSGVSSQHDCQGALSLLLSLSPPLSRPSQILFPCSSVVFSFFFSFFFF